MSLHPSQHYFKWKRRRMRDGVQTLDDAFRHSFLAISGHSHRLLVVSAKSGIQLLPHHPMVIIQDTTRLRTKAPVEL